ncbi:very short patch repair endonuclease [Nitrolancea hollandica]|uniref:XorII very short patch repair endonuclease n=1 Tax=Nitrolancea hollandica Lb TaxID=1129897 RepID=I4EN67_9BACT|nr:XorII very short patch repair endonuclease [Nitrolancea hollandica Lb]
MVDSLSPDERSERMARVRSTGNRSTEGRVEAALVSSGISGWEKHPRDIPGKPDFFFDRYRLALFIDGCFWHGCPKCQRRMPKARAEFWQAKIEGNRQRDRRVRRKLWSRGYHVMRVWEHDLNRDTWLRRLQAMMRRIAISREDDS